RFSSHTRGLDVFFLLLRKDAPSQHPGIAGHRGNTYGQVKGEKGRSHRRNQSYGEESSGKSQEGVDEAHRYRIQPASGVSRDSTQRDANDDGKEDSPKCHAHGDASAEDDAGVDITPVNVRSQKML